MKRFLQSTYVDDIISGADSDEEAFELYTQAKEIFRHEGFNLRKFLSNSQPLQAKIDFAEGVTESDPANRINPSYAKVIGVTWNPHSDSLVFNQRVGRLCREGADAQYVQYLSKSRITSPQTR